MYLSYHYIIRGVFLIQQELERISRVNGREGGFVTVLPVSDMDQVVVEVGHGEYSSFIALQII
jgi:hypothetical protein